MKHSLFLGAGLVALAGPAVAAGSCQFTSGPIKHLIVIEFDNVHLPRTNPNVPSDMEQMPALLNFLTANGTVNSNHHPPLISHTANDFMSTETGVYPDRLGTGISNSFLFYPGGKGTAQYASDFVYWTDPVASSGDTTPTVLAETGKNAPAPWVAFTRAGCDVGFAGSANVVLENTSPDVARVFGANSPEAAEAKSNPTKASADFVGIGIHCAQSSTICPKSHAVADALPDEPGGYTGFQALYGHKYAMTALTGSATIKTLSGKSLSGFPGFGGLPPDTSMAYMATMLEGGVPVVYAYVTTAHNGASAAYGPGQSAYEATLRAYNASFATFFQRLSTDGITAANSLFVVLSDEADHFVGGPPSPANCDGVNTPCTYAKLGEVDLEIARELLTADNNTTAFGIHADMAPAFYVGGNPAQTAATVRRLEEDMGKLKVTDPVNNQNVAYTTALADQAEMTVLHVVSADPYRTPTFVNYTYPDFYSQVTATSPKCNTGSPCIKEDDYYAWNHGGIAPDVGADWMAMAGPGVQVSMNTPWTDQPDVRPTYLSLLGLKDDYVHDGRVVAELLNAANLPASVAANLSAYTALTTAYKQLDAPFNQAATYSLSYATSALEQTNAATYSTYLTRLGNYNKSKIALVAQIKTLIDGVFFGGQTFSVSQAQSLTSQANTLVQQIKTLAGQ